MAKVNSGKVFEKNFMDSVPDYALIYRIPDAAQSFGYSKNLRFSNRNPFDYIIWDSRKHILYALELKTIDSKSIPFDRSPEDKNGKIHYHQIVGLNKWNEYDGIIAALIIEFRQIEKTVFIRIEDFNELMEKTPKKSFNYDDLKKYQIKYLPIMQHKKKVNYRYDVGELLEAVSC
jgi:penicillin-binding protein-related factor A (putative recombinase)